MPCDIVTFVFNARIQMLSSMYLFIECSEYNNLDVRSCIWSKITIFEQKSSSTLLGTEVFMKVQKDRAVHFCMYLWTMHGRDALLKAGILLMKCFWLFFPLIYASDPIRKMMKRQYSKDKWLTKYKSEDYTVWHIYEDTDIHTVFKNHQKSLTSK